LLVPIGGLIIAGTLWALPSMDTPAEDSTLPS